MKSKTRYRSGVTTATLDDEREIYICVCMRETRAYQLVVCLQIREREPPFPRRDDLPASDLSEWDAKKRGDRLPKEAHEAKRMGINRMYSRRADGKTWRRRSRWGTPAKVDNTIPGVGKRATPPPLPPSRCS